MSILIVQFRSCNNFNIDLDRIVKVLSEYNCAIKEVERICGPPSFVSVDFSFNNKNEAHQAYTHMYKLFGVNVLCHVF
jgi:hypothetical protein